MFGTVSHELEVNVPASKAWELYGTLRLAKLVEEKLSQVVHKIEVVEGDGGVGTVVNLIFQPGTSPVASYKEKFTRIDELERTKEAEVIEGGYLDLGFTLYRVRFKVIEKSEDWCITRATIEYDLKEEASANASIVTVQPLAMLMSAAADLLLIANKSTSVSANN